MLQCRMLHQIVKFLNGASGLTVHQNVTLDQSMLDSISFCHFMSFQLFVFLGRGTGDTSILREVQIVLWTCTKFNHAEVMKLTVLHQENLMVHPISCLLPPTWEWEATLMMDTRKKTHLVKPLTGVHGVLAARNVDQVSKEGPDFI